MKQEIEKRKLECIWKLKKIRQRGVHLSVCVCVFERKTSSMGVRYQLHDLFSVKGASSATYTQKSNWHNERGNEREIGFHRQARKKKNITPPPRSASLAFWVFLSTKRETSEPLIWAVLCHRRNVPLVWDCVCVCSEILDDSVRPQPACLTYLPERLWTLPSCMVAHSVISGSRVWSHSLSGYLMVSACRRNQSVGLIMVLSLKSSTRSLILPDETHRFYFSSGF